MIRRKRDNPAGNKTAGRKRSQGAAKKKASGRSAAVGKGQPGRAAGPRKKAKRTSGRPGGRRPAASVKKGSKGSKRKVSRKSYFEYSFLVILTMAILGLGVVMVFSASWAQGFFSDDGGLTQHPDSYRYLKRELIFAAIGIASMFALARYDYRKLRQAAKPMMIASIGLLVLVFTPLGVMQNGARSWIGAEGVLTFQPSELAKLAAVIYIAARMYEKPRLLGDLRQIVGPVLGLPLIALGLIVFEPDMGTASIMFTAMVMMLIVGGVRLRMMATIGAFTGLAAMASLLFFPHGRERVTSYVDSLLHFWDISFIRSWSAAQDAGFQLVQSLVAMGSGGLFGIGLGESVQKFNYLPEAHTDMILSIIGEELGLAGVLLVVVAFTAFAYMGFRIALKCNDRFGKFLAAGITSLLVGQAAINVSAATGILPLTGIPLPLISYGGSSLVVILSAVGILLNISVNKRGSVGTARFKSIEGGNRGRRDGRPPGSRSRARERAYG